MIYIKMRKIEKCDNNSPTKKIIKVMIAKDP